MLIATRRMRQIRRRLHLKIKSFCGRSTELCWINFPQKLFTKRAENWTKNGTVWVWTNKSKMLWRRERSRIKSSWTKKRLHLTKNLLKITWKLRPKWFRLSVNERIQNALTQRTELNQKFLDAKEAPFDEKYLENFVKIEAKTAPLESEIDCGTWKVWQKWLRNFLWKYQEIGENGSVWEW